MKLIEVTTIKKQLIYVNIASIVSVRFAEDEYTSDGIFTILDLVDGQVLHLRELVPRVLMLIEKQTKEDSYGMVEDKGCRDRAS